MSSATDGPIVCGVAPSPLRSTLPSTIRRGSSPTSRSSCALTRSIRATWRCCWPSTPRRRMASACGLPVSSPMRSSRTIQRLYRSVLAEVWPTARHQLCLFHATRRVVRAVSDVVKQVRRTLPTSERVPQEPEGGIHQQRRGARRTRVPPGPAPTLSAPPCAID